VPRANPRSFYYFDFAAGFIVLLLVAGVLPRLLAGHASWSLPELISLSVFAAALVVASSLRQRAYSQPTPWLVTGVAVSGLVAVVVVFSQWNTIWFGVITLIAIGVVLCGAAARSKTISEPVGRAELRTLFAIVATSVVTLLMLEGLVRAASGAFKPEIRQMLRVNPANYGVADSYIGHLHTPNSAFTVSGRDFEAVHHVGSHGFRNTAPWPAQADVVVVGDSLVFGYGVADGQDWPTILAGTFANMRVVNLGLVGAGPQQYLRVFERFGRPLNPKVVLVGIYATNDFSDAATFADWQRSGVGGNDMV